MSSNRSSNYYSGDPVHSAPWDQTYPYPGEPYIDDVLIAGADLSWSFSSDETPHSGAELHFGHGGRVHVTCRCLVPEWGANHVWLPHSSKGWLVPCFGRSYRVFVCSSRLPYHLLDAGGSAIQVIRCLYIWHASSPMCPLQLCDWEPSELVTVHAYEALNDGVLGRVSRGNLLAVYRQVGRVFAA